MDYAELPPLSECELLSTSSDFRHIACISRIHDREPHYYADGEDAYDMRKYLKPASGLGTANGGTPGKAKEDAGKQQADGSTAQQGKPSEDARPKSGDKARRAKVAVDEVD